MSWSVYPDVAGAGPFSPGPNLSHRFDEVWTTDRDIQLSCTIATKCIPICHLAPNMNAPCALFDAINLFFGERSIIVEPRHNVIAGEYSAPWRYISLWWRKIKIGGQRIGQDFNCKVIPDIKSWRDTVVFYSPIDSSVTFGSIVFDESCCDREIRPQLGSRSFLLVNATQNQSQCEYSQKSSSNCRNQRVVTVGDSLRAPEIGEDGDDSGIFLIVGILGGGLCGGIVFYAILKC